jgi:excisionase family DNA binding protein
LASAEGVNPEESAEPLHTVQDVARRFNVPVSWAYAKAEANEIVHHKLGRYLRFRACDIEAYLSAQRRGGEAK